MGREGQTLMRAYFKENGFIRYNIESFNTLASWRLQKFVDDLGDVSPTVLPPEAESVVFKFGKIAIQKPEIVEADGVRRPLLPGEARLRDLTYAASVYLEVYLFINNKEKERAEVKIFEFPVMLKSNLCYLREMGKEELIGAGEDPNDPGGYFIVNGTERCLILLEDLAPNTIFAEIGTGAVTHSTRIYSEGDQYRSSLRIERQKDGLLFASFAGIKIPIFVLMKALGLTQDKQLVGATKSEDDDLYVNIYENLDVKTEEDAKEFIAKRLKISRSVEQKERRLNYLFDRELLPHIGGEEAARRDKARFMGRLINQLLLLKNGVIEEDQKDHCANKRVRLSGDLFEELFKTHLKSFTRDLLYVFQRGVRRGKILPISSMVQSKFLTSRINSAMATGSWPRGRQGVSQSLDRVNPIATLAHLRRVSSLLASERENFEARELHPTQYGKFCPIDSPEGGNIGLRKQLALLARITPKLRADIVENGLKIVKSLLGSESPENLSPKQSSNKLVGSEAVLEGKTDVFYNGGLAGVTNAPKEFVKRVRAARAENRLSKFLNVYFNTEKNIVYVFLENGRIQRPVIPVKNEVPVLMDEHLKQIKDGGLKWSDLETKQLIRYLDAAEEEDSLIAIRRSDLTKNHDYLEVDPLAMFGTSTSMIPYSNYSPSSRLLRGQKTQKQGMSCYALNYHNRMDTNIDLTDYPQRPIVRSFMQSIVGDYKAGGQNVVVAVMNYEGYNMEDALVVNKQSIERGYGRSTHFRPYITERRRYYGGQVDQIQPPDKDVQGYTTEEDYRFLTEDGIAFKESELKGGEVVIGRMSPPRFLSKLGTFSTVATTYKDTSVRVRANEEGIIGDAFLTENVEGNLLIKAKLRAPRNIAIGDKFSSRSGQKGVVGHIVDSKDIPFSASGLVPDIIFSPNSLVGRMTINYMIELLGGKVGAGASRFVDGTPFASESLETLRKTLLELGFRDDGTETLYDGRTGRQYPARIFIGSMFYLRLYHQVRDKIQARGRGPVQLLTRQPTEGRAKEGGTRFGEMEKETLVGHGASLLLKDRFDSDKTVIYVCGKCGDVAVYNFFTKKAECLSCGERIKIYPVEMSYAFKLVLDELKSMHMKPRLILEDKF